MSFHSISTAKSPKAIVPDSRKIPSSPKPTRLNAKAEYYSMGVITENKDAAKQVQPDKKKPALEIQLTRPGVNNDRRAITQSRSPPSFKSPDPGTSRFNVLKQHLSPTSAKSGTSMSFAKKEAGKSDNKETSILDASIEQSVKANSRLEKPKANSALTNRPSGRTTANPKPEPTIPLDRLAKKLVKGISPSTTKLRDSSRDYGLNKRASETDRATVDSPFDLEAVKNMKPNTPSASILRKNSKFGFDANRETNSGRLKNSIADQNTGRSTKRYTSPSASTTNIHKKTPSDISHESNNTSKTLHRQPGTASSATIRRSVRISEEDLGLSGLNAINEAVDGNKDSQNGSCSRERSKEPEKTSSESPPKYKKLNLVIPTVQINAGDLQNEGTKSAKHSANTMRSMFYNLNHSIIEESPTHTENKSARLFSSTNVEEKPNPISTPTPTPAEEKQKMYPSRNSDFNFQMKYFKPIEEAKLEEFIQTVNESKKVAAPNDDESSQNNTTILISKSPEKRDKSSLHLPRSQVGTPKMRNSSPSMASLLGTSRDKSAKRNPPPTHSRGLSPQPLVKAPTKNREDPDKLFKTENKKPEINSYPSVFDPKVRLRSPIKKWEQVTPRSPLRSGASSGAHTLRNSVDAKEPSSSFVRSSFSRQHQNSKLAEEMESIPVVIDLEGKELKKKGEQHHIIDDRFSNLDKLLAQLRNNPLKQMEFSLADTEDSEKGLFNAGGNDEVNESKNSESKNSESQVNKSFARNLMKFSHHN